MVLRGDEIAAAELSLLALSYLGRGRAHRNSGGGTFVRVAAMAVSEHPFALATAYLDGDDHLDLAVPGEVGDTVSILFGRGDGSIGRLRWNSSWHRDAEIGKQSFRLIFVQIHWIEIFLLECEGSRGEAGKIRRIL